MSVYSKNRIIHPNLTGLRDMKKPSHIKRQEELGQPILITATRKYDRRKKEHRDKEQILTLYYNNNDGFFSHCYNEKDFDESEILIFQKVVRQILKRFDVKLSDLIFEVA